MISINNNLGGLRAHEALAQSHRHMQISLERLSSGLRINRAEDDAAGVMLRDRFRAQVYGFEEGIRNIQTASGMIQVAEQGMNKITDALQQIRSLAVRAADDNLNDEDRGRVQNQIKGLLREINERAERTDYNGHKLLNGSISEAHEERRASAKVQTNSFLTNGNTLVVDAEVLRNASTTPNAVSQGSYEVKLVYDASDREFAVPTSTTVIKGTNYDEIAYLNSVDVNSLPGQVVSRTETVVDRDGNEHSVLLNFTSTSATTWSYAITAPNGGAWIDPIATSGTLTFSAATGLLTNVTAAGIGASAAGTTITQTITDTGAGQTWNIDLSMLRNNAQPPVIDNPTEPVDGVAGGSPTTQVTFNSQLDSNAAAGFTTARMGISTWVDRNGTNHDVGFVFTKVTENSGANDVWDVSITGSRPGGAWTGTNQHVTRRIEFDGSGALYKVSESVLQEMYVILGDGTTSGQRVDVDMSRLTSTPGASHVSATTDGLSTIKTTQVTYTGNVDKDELTAFTVPLGNVNLIDRMGVEHATYVQFTKSATNEWAYSFNGLAPSSVWTGVSGATSGVLTFDDQGDVATINGAAPALFTLNFSDGTTTAAGTNLGQDVVIDFRQITQLSNGTTGQTTLASSSSGTPTVPGTTHNAAFNGVINATAAPIGTTASQSITWFDRNGTEHTVTIDLQKQTNATADNSLQDTWSYSLSGFTTTGSAGSGAPGVAWTGLTAGSATGTVTFNSSGLVTSPAPFNITIGDGTNGGQTVTVDLRDIQTLQTVTSTSGSQDGSATAPDATSNVRYTGQLDKDHLFASSPTFTTQNTPWYDRLGVAHATSMTFTKTNVNQWSYSINGLSPAGGSGAWNGGAASGAYTGTLNFNDDGTLRNVNGSGSTASLTVDDDVIGSGQNVTIDFGSLVVPGVTQSGRSGITQPGDGAISDSTVNQAGNVTSDGTNPPPGITTSATFTGTLEASAALGASTSSTMTWYDRDGIARDVTLSVTKTANNVTTVGLQDSWSYTFSAPTNATWASGINQTGTFTFSAAGVMTSAASVNVNVSDGTQAGQTVSVNVGSIIMRNQIVAPAGTQNGSAVAPTLTSQAQYAGLIDKDLAVGSLVSTASKNWYDRQGTAHSVRVDFRKQASPPSNTWTYSITNLVSGIWLGATSGNATGNVTFDDAGNLTAVNGDSSAGFKDFTVQIQDDTAERQLVLVDFGSTVNGFAGITQPGNGSTDDSTVSNAANNVVNGSASPPGLTTTATYTGTLDASAAATTTTSIPVTWFDRDGQGHTVTMNLTKSVQNTGSNGLQDQWDYSFSGLTGGVWASVHSGATTGTLTFNTDGTLASPTSLSFVINDGTVNTDDSVKGQTVSLNLSALQNLTPLDPLDGSQSVVTPSASNRTSQAQYAGFLDQDVLVGSTYNTDVKSWFDRGGNAHNVHVNFTKTAANTWTYSVVGLDAVSGFWEGSASGRTSGTLTFDAAGAFISRDEFNSGSQGATGNFKTFDLVVDDGTTTGHTVRVDFGTLLGGITQPTDAADSTVVNASNSVITPTTSVGADPTTDENFTARLSLAALQGETSTQTIQWYDRTGVSHDVTLSMARTANADRWTFSLTGLNAATGAWTGSVAPTDYLSGTLVFSGGALTDVLDANSVSRGTGDLAITIQDGTFQADGTTPDGQAVNVNFSAVTRVADTQNGSAAPPNPTTTSDFNGNLDKDLASGAGSAQTTATRQWFDRLGVAHNVSITFQKTAANQWSYSLNGLTTAGGAWTGGAASANATGTVQFNDAGILTQINGAAFATFNVTVADDTDTDQTILVDLTSLTQTGNGSLTDSTVDVAANNPVDGSATAPGLTTTATYDGILDASAAAATTTDIAVIWHDRNGQDHVVTMRLTKNTQNTGSIGLQDTWDYSFSGFTGGAWTGIHSGATTGTLSFNADGTLASPTSLSFVVADGTFNVGGSVKGQSVALNLSALRNLTPLAALDGTQNVVTPSASNRTSQAQYSGFLDQDALVGTVEDAATKSWFDRNGASHNVFVRFEKTAANTWSYSINGITASGVWTGSASGDTSGTLTFDSAGALIARNGSSAAGFKAFDVVVADGTTTGQTVNVDFGAFLGGVTQPSDAGDSTVSSAANSVLTPAVSVGADATLSEAFVGRLSEVAPTGYTQAQTLQWYDRSGVSHDVTLTLTKSALANEWDYVLSGLTAVNGAWTGTVGGNQTGTLVYTGGSLTDILNSGRTSLGTGALSFNISDGTFQADGTTPKGQTVSVTMNGITRVADTQNGSAAPPDPTEVADYNGNLDKDLASGSSQTTATRQWFDRLGTAHNVSVTYTKTSANLWSYSINGLTTAGGAWTGGAASANATGTVRFNDAGVLTQINGAAPATFNVTVANDAGGQVVNVDLRSLTQTGNGATTDSTVGVAANNPVDGSASPPGLTTTATYDGILDASAAVSATSDVAVTWHDRNGQDHTVTMHLAKATQNAGLNDAWSYSFSGLSGGVWSSVFSGATTGTLSFNADGTLASPTSLTFVINDGTFNTDDSVKGQTVALNLSALRNLTPLADLDGTQNVVTPSASNRTSQARYAGTLDQDLVTGSVRDSATSPWFDRNGASHNVFVRFEKTAANTWSYSINGIASNGVWTGSAAGDTSGTLTFDPSGALIARNGSSAAGFKAFDIVVADGTTTGQTVNVDFGSYLSGITQPSDAGDSTVSQAANTVVTPAVSVGPDATLDQDFAARLSQAALTGATAAQTVQWYDRTGNAHDVTLTLTKSALADEWDYALSGLSAVSGAWSGTVSGNTTGTLVFTGGALTDVLNSSRVSQGTGALSFNISDGTFQANGTTPKGQTVSVDFNGIARVADTQNGSASPPNPTSDADFFGNLDKDLATGAGSTQTSATRTFYDRLGTSHSVSLTFVKTNTNTWSYSVNGLTAGGAWTGGASGATTGTVTFNDAGVLQTINGAAPATFNLTIADDTVTDQIVNFDLRALTQTGNGTTNLSQLDVTRVQDGSTSTPGKTANVTYTAQVNGTVATGDVEATRSLVATYYDRSGAAHDVTLTLTKTTDNGGNDDTWSYALTSPADDVWTAGVTGATPGSTGSFTFSGGATAASTTLQVTDRTGATQNVLVSFSGLTSVSVAQSSTSDTRTGYVQVSGDLDTTSSTYTTSNAVWTRNNGGLSGVSVTFNKVDADNWTYTINGLDNGVNWLGATSNGSGDIAFVGGVVQNPLREVVISGSAGQTVSVDFSGLVQTATPSTAAQTVTAETRRATYTAELNADLDTVSRSFQLTWLDSRGASHDVTLNLSKTTNNAGLADVWSYSFSGLDSTGAGGHTWTPPTNSTGTFAFNAAGVKTSGNITLDIADGSGAAQPVTINWDNELTSRSFPFSAVVDGSTAAADLTTEVDYGGSLDADVALLSGVTVSTDWYDRLGVAHNVDVALTRTSTNVWSYSITVPAGASSAWTGGAVDGTGLLSGTLEFDDATRALSKINGVAAALFNVKVNDYTAGDQTITIDFLSLTQPTNGATTDSTVAVPANSTSNGTSAAPDPTTTENFAARLDGGAATGSVVNQTATWYDRSGLGHTVTLALSKTSTDGDGTGAESRWSYSVTGLSGGVWTSASGPTSGTLDFDASGVLIDVNDNGNTSAVTIDINDGTTGHQNVALSFTNMASLAATQDGSAVVPTPTTNAQYKGVLDGDLAVGQVQTTDATSTWKDRLGTAHNVNVTFTKTALNTWAYMLNGLTNGAGAWQDASTSVSGPATGTLIFNDSGSLISVNGVSTGDFKKFNITVPDDTTANQTVQVSFEDLTQPRDGAVDDSTVSSSGNSSVNGSNTVPAVTSTATYTAHLDADAASATQSEVFSWYDRNGGSHSVTLTLNKTNAAGLADSWGYTFSGLDSLGSTGVQWGTADQSGTLTFDANGDLTSGNSIVLVIEDGTGPDQTVTVNVGGIKNDAAPADAPGGVQNGTGADPDKTTTAGFNGNLDADLGVAATQDSARTADTQWYDRLGVGHDVYVKYTKTDTNLWSYSIQGLNPVTVSGAWDNDAATTGTLSGTLEFNENGTLFKVNGSTTFTVGVVVSDDTAANHSVTVDFTGLTQNGNGATTDSTVAVPANSTSDGTAAAPDPTTVENFAARLDGGAATGASVAQQAQWFDRDGVAHTVTLALTKTSTDGDSTGAGSRWSWSVSGLSGGVWTGATGTSGTLDFDASGALIDVNDNGNTNAVTLAISDGTTGGQNVALSFTNIASVPATQDGSATVPTPTTNAQYKGVLDGDSGVGQVQTTSGASAWTDRLGTAHNVNVRFEKTALNTWTYTLNGLTNGTGAWQDSAGAVSGAATGTLTFNDSGDLISVNGNTTGSYKKFNITVPDDTAANQTVEVSFEDLTQPRNGAVNDSTVSTAGNSSANGTNTVPAVTSSATYTARLDADAATGATQSDVFSWYDRNGGSHSVTLTLTKTNVAGLGDSWGYSFSGVDSLGSTGVQWGGANSGGSGTLTFDASGNLSSASPLVLVIEDGTGADQTVSIDVSGIKNDAAPADAPAGVQNGSGVDPDKTALATYRGNLDADLAIGQVQESARTADTMWYDRLGVGHDVYVTYSKSDTNLWNYTIQGLNPVAVAGAWDNETATTGTLTGTLLFNENGSLAQVNGSATLTLGIVVSDDTAANQAVTVNFASLTQTGNGATTDSTVAVPANSTSNGTSAAPDPTTVENFASRLDGGAATGSTMTQTATWYDRKGLSHTVTLALTKDAADGDGTGAGSRWNYSVTGFTGGVWTGATMASPTTGTLDFNAAGALIDVNDSGNTNAVTLSINDGTTGRQNVALSFTNMAATASTQDGSATVPTPTTAAQYKGVLDGDLAVGQVQTTNAASAWTDCLGTAHNVSVRFEKTALNTWTYTLNGLTNGSGAWQDSAGTVGGPTTGTLIFNDAGDLLSVNGVSSGDYKKFNITVPDDTAVEQTVQVSFEALSQPRNGAVDDTTVSSAANSVVNGTNAVPAITATAAYDAHLDSSAATNTVVSKAFDWYDRNGGSHSVTLQLTKTNVAGLGDAWAYSFLGLSSTGSTGVAWGGANSGNASGTVQFDADGNLVSPSSVVLNIEDGTDTDQTVTVSFTGLRNDAAPAATPSGVQNGSGQDPDKTSTSNFRGAIDADFAVGTVLTSARTADTQWYDRLGVGHDVYVTYTKTATHEWTYALQGLSPTDGAGAWDNDAATVTSPPNKLSGTLRFADNGSLAAVNGSGTLSFNVVVSDDTAANQTVLVDFTSLTQPGDGSTAQSTLATAANSALTPSAAPPAPGTTSSATYTANLDSNAAASTVVATNFNWFDRKGVAHDVTLTLTKQTNNSNLNDLWAYSLSGLGSDSSGLGGIDWNDNLNTTTTGTIQFDANGNVSQVNGIFTSAFTVRVSDGTYNSPGFPGGTEKGQTVTVSLSGVRNQAATDNTAGDAASLTALSGTQNVPTPVPGPNANAPDRTDNASYSGLLDADVSVGFTVDSAVRGWFDRLGQSHNVSVQFRKTDTNAWAYTFNGLTAGGAWNSTSLANRSGVMTFDENGALTSVNGSSAAGFAQFTLQVDDDVLGSTQDVLINFSGLTQPGNGSTDDTTVTAAGATSANGTATVPGTTHNAVYSGDLDSKAAVGATSSRAINWFDRNGVAHSVNLVLTKATNVTATATQLADTWNYSLSSAVSGLWTSGLSTTGTIAFGNDGNVVSVNGNAGRTYDIFVDDDTVNPDLSARNQQVTLNFTDLRNNAGPTFAVNGTQDGTATAPDRTSTSDYSGNLDPEEAVGFSATTTPITWYDRLGQGHSTSVTYVKTDTNEWSYSVSGLTTASAAWTGGAPGGPVTGILSFNDLGDLIAVNGSSAVGFERVDITVADDVLATDHAVRLSFAGMTQITDGTPINNTVAGSRNGRLFNTTTTATFNSRVMDGQGPVVFPIADIIDNTGMDAVGGTTVTFGQVLDTNYWTWSVQAPVGSGFTGDFLGGQPQGLVQFNDAGNLVGPSSFTVVFEDGIPGGHSVLFDISALRMGRVSDIDGTTTDGSSLDSGEVQVNAEIYYSGSGSSAPVTVVEDISRSSRRLHLGGVSLTINQVSTLDVGLVSYIKAYTYVSATAVDNALQFQVGPDEGMTTRIGIDKMDVSSIFRLNGDGGTTYAWDDINLLTTLEAQDLIGQIDDALDFVGGQNLKVGQFQNAMTRQLDLQRQTATSVTSMLAQLEDTDVAVEASKMSRRMIMVQSGTAMVAQANSTAQFILQLLR